MVAQHRQRVAVCASVLQCMSMTSVCVCVSLCLCGCVVMCLYGCVCIYTDRGVICVDTTGQRRLRFSMCVCVYVFASVFLCGYVAVSVYTDIVVSFVSAPPDEDASDSERQAVANEIRQRCLDMLMLAGTYSANIRYSQLRAL